MTSRRVRTVPGALTIFVVDDDPGLRSVIGELAEAAGDCRLWDTAATGEEALDRLARCDGDDRPDVVLLDVELPGIDGFAVARRQLAVDPATRIVLMSTHAADDLPPDAVSGGVLDFVSKVELSPSRLSSFRALL